MRHIITIIALMLIWLPYKMSDYSKDSGFFQDFCVAFLCFGLGSVIAKSVNKKKAINKIVPRHGGGAEDKTL
jgi:hypothetical protein